jgi:hypothetical protein
MIPDEWKYIRYREDIYDHCQWCNKETNKLHWYNVDRCTAATLCDACKKKLESD